MLLWHSSAQKCPELQDIKEIQTYDLMNIGPFTVYHDDGVFTHKALGVVLFIALRWSELDLTYHQRS